MYFLKNSIIKFSILWRNADVFCIFNDGNKPLQLIINSKKIKKTLRNNSQSLKGEIFIMLEN